ncbi:MAG: c-type cytochrome [Planctomycetes bacterium]|nr:c-type cytochrome [Planctomycetota bacterium]
MGLRTAGIAVVGRMLVTLLLFAWSSRAQSVPGLVCEFESGVGPRSATERTIVDARRVDRVALHVTAGEPAADALRPGPFRATWRGRLLLDLRSKLRFAARGHGYAKLSIGGQVVFEGGDDRALDVSSEEARWPQGENEFLFEYASAADGSGDVRLLWAGRGFDWEPIAPTVLRHDSAQEPAEALARRRGRELFLERRCFACHSPGTDAAARLAAVGAPELSAAAPDLSRAGQRLEHDWIVHWLTDPRALRPGARMPSLLGGGDRTAHFISGDTRALDLAAFVAARGASGPPPTPQPAPPSNADAATGARLFAELGCIACHTRPDPGAAAPTADRVPLQFVASKWKRAGLIEFLRDPTSIDPWIRMPDLDLTQDEAEALAGFLIERSSPQRLPLTPEGGDATRGAATYTMLGCAQCHEPVAAKSTPPSFAAIAAVDWRERGCAAEPAARAPECPDYAFEPADRAALQQFGGKGLATLAQRNRADFAERQMRELQCHACHTIGAQRDRWQEHVTETNDLLQGVPRPELDQARPGLTFAGEKLHSDWIARLLEGEVTPRTRPWLRARMPAFRTRADLLATGLAARDGFAPSAPVRPAALAAASDADRQAAERLLFDTQRGFSCIGCHDIGDQPARSRFEFGAPNLALAHARIRPDYYRRWMANPMRVEPSSKMPNYAGDDGKSPFTDLLDGDLPRQFEAMRLWLAELAQRGGR